MAPLFSRKTNQVTVTGLPIYKTIRGNFVTKNGTPVQKYGSNWASINNRANMRSLLRTHGFMYNNNTPMNVIISRYKRNKKIS